VHFVLLITVCQPNHKESRRVKDQNASIICSLRVVGTTTIVQHESWSHGGHFRGGGQRPLPPLALHDNFLHILRKHPPGLEVFSVHF